MWRLNVVHFLICLPNKSMKFPSNTACCLTTRITLAFGGGVFPLFSHMLPNAVGGECHFQVEVTQRAEIKQ